MTMSQICLLLAFMGFASKFASLTSWQRLQFVFKFFRMFSIFTFNIPYGQPILIPEKTATHFQDQEAGVADGDDEDVQLLRLQLREVSATSQSA